MSHPSQIAVEVSNKLIDQWDDLLSTDVQQIVQQAMEQAMVPMQAKLDFLKLKGMTVGYMKTSDKPDPYLVYVIEPDSELCALKTVNKLIDVELERDRLQKRVEELESKNTLWQDGRMQGREEALYILLGRDPETFLSDYQFSSPIGDTGDYRIEWEAEKLRSLFNVGEQASVFERMETSYWESLATINDLASERASRRAAEAALAEMRAASGLSCAHPEGVTPEHLSRYINKLHSQLAAGAFSSEFVLPMTLRKLHMLLESAALSGFVVTKPDGSTGILDKAAVRWLSNKEEWHHFFHPPQEGEVREYWYCEQCAEATGRSFYTPTRAIQCWNCKVQFQPSPIRPEIVTGRCIEVGDLIIEVDREQLRNFRGSLLFRSLEIRLAEQSSNGNAKGDE